jgi:hypothetical protein
MNYLRHYNLLISRAHDRKIIGYTERHHIIPRCMGGTDDIINLVNLTAREHFIAHQLLVKIYPENRSLVFAARMMTFNSPDHRGERSNNRLYSWLKERHILAKIGTTHSLETKLKMSESAKGKPKTEEAKRNMRKPKQHYISKKGIPTNRVTGGAWAEGNIPWNKGKSHMVGENNPAFGKEWDDEKRNKMSTTNKGRKRVHREDGTFYYIYPHLENKVIQ